MKNIDTDLILAAIERGESYRISEITPKMLGYVRCWANRRGYFVTKEGKDAIVSKEKEDKLRTELFKKLPDGNTFFIAVNPDQMQYLRNLVSQYNKTAAVKYRTQSVTGGYVLFPNPAHGIDTGQTKT